VSPASIVEAYFLPIIKRAPHIKKQPHIFLNNKQVIRTQCREVIVPGTSPIDSLRIPIYAEKCDIKPSQGSHSRTRQGRSQAQTVLRVRIRRTRIEW